MTVTLEYLRSRAAELDRAEVLLEKQARDFFTGRRVRVIHRGPEGDLTGQVLQVKSALYWQGRIWLQVIVRDKTRSVQLDHVELIRESIIA